ncbi:MAG: hypothetical protein AAF985_13215, partial [Bacteroidota bacterium]
MRTRTNNPFPSLFTKGVFVKALALLTGIQLFAFSYFIQEIQMSNTPHTVNQVLPLTYESKDWTSYDRKSQKLMVYQSQEAVSKHNRATFKFAVLSPYGSNNVQLYCSALEAFEGRIAIRNVIGEEMGSVHHQFAEGKQVLEIDVADWMAGEYL